MKRLIGHLRTELRVFVHVIIHPSVVGRYSRRYGHIRTAIAVISLVQMAMGAWLIVTSGIIRIAPWSAVGIVLLPLKTIVLFFLSGMIMHILARFAHADISLATGCAISFRAAYLAMIGNFVFVGANVLLGGARMLTTQTVIPGLDRLIRSSGILQRALGDINPIMLWILLVLILMARSAANERWQAGLLIGGSSWMFLFLVRIAVAGMIR